MTVKSFGESNNSSKGHPSSGFTNQITLRDSPRLSARTLAEFIARILLHNPPIGCIINISVSFFLIEQFERSSFFMSIAEIT